MEPEEQITIDDILEDLRINQNKTEKPEGVTAAEFAEILGIGEKKAAKMLKKLVHSGKLKVSRVEIKDVAGRRNFTFIYHP